MGGKDARVCGKNTSGCFGELIYSDFSKAARRASDAVRMCFTFLFFFKRGEKMALMI